jgi:hypothetical protein
MRVDVERLRQAGHGFMEAAEAVPDAPEQYIPQGSDPLTAAVAAEAPKVAAPVAEGLRALKAEGKAYAQKVIDTAQMYADTDEQTGHKVGQHRFEGSDSSGSGSGGGVPRAGGSLGGGAGGRAAGSGGSGGSQATGAGESGEALSAMGQMMGMPMEAVSQAAQMPTQLGGMVGGLPQQMMQAAQGPMGQVQHIGQVFHDEDKAGSDEPGEAGKARVVDETRPADAEGAASGASAGGQQPESAPVDTAPPTTEPGDPSAGEHDRVL